MSRRGVHILAILFWALAGTPFVRAQNPVLDASARVLGGPLNYFAARPAAFLGNPANLGLNGWDRVSFHLNRAYRFNSVAANGFFPGTGHLGGAVSLFSSQVQCFQVGFARRLSRKISWGTRLNVGSFFDRKSVQADIGLAYRLGILNEDVFPVEIGLGGHVSKINLRQGKGSSPEFNFGGEIAFSDRLVQIYPGFSFSHKKERLAFGVSFSPVGWLHFRAGSSDLKREKIMAGIGVDAGRYGVDVAYEAAGKRLHASLSFLFGASPTEKAQKLFDQGKAALEKHHLATALRAFRKAWFYNPENEFYQKSYQLVARRLQFQENQRQSLMNQALQYQKEGYFFLAATRYLEVLKKFPGYRPAQLRLQALRPLVATDINRLLKKGEEYVSKGELEIARQILEKILLLDSQNKQARTLMAKIDAKSHERADEYFYRGLGYYSQRNLKRAEAEFRQTLEIDPNYEEARVYLGEIEKNNRQKRAQIDSLLQGANRWESKKRYTKAIDNYLRVLDLDPENAQAKAGVKRLNAYVKKQLRANLRKCRMALKRGEFTRANRYLRRVLRIFPKNKQARALREEVVQARTIRYNEFLDKAEEARHTGRLVEALQFYQKARALRPSDKKLLKTISEVQGEIELSKNFSRGEDALNTGDFATAVRYFEKVLRTDPENNAAAAYLQQAKDKLREQVKSLLQKGIELYTKEDYPAAIRVFSRLLTLDPNNRVAKEYYQRSVVKQKAIDNLK